MLHFPLSCILGFRDLRVLSELPVQVSDSDYAEDDHSDLEVV